VTEATVWANDALAKPWNNLSWKPPAQDQRKMWTPIIQSPDVDTHYSFGQKRLLISSNSMKTMGV
jgi:hypothetical protein